MTRVSVFTGTRAEYGLLYWLLKAIDESDDLELQLIVTGSHLSHEYGYTIEEILRDGFEPKQRIPCLLSSDDPVAISKSMAILSSSLADYLERECPDYFVVLGDRFEILAACQAAMISKVPIVHIHGGEITEGAIDEKIRHAVTKLSSLHFTSTEEYRKRVIQMGECPDRVVNCGALGVESIVRYELLSKAELEKALNVNLGDKYFLVAYHPETQKDVEDISGLLDVLSDYPEYKKVVIYPNADMMSRSIILSFEAYRDSNPSSVFFLKSVSHKAYLSLMKHCTVLIGNSSSGIIEAPSFSKPVVNIGARQQGRIRSSHVIDVCSDYTSISNGLKRALTKSFQERLPSFERPYGGGDSSKIIIDTIRKLDRNLMLQKSFFDIEF